MAEMKRKTINIVNYWENESGGKAMVTMQVDIGQIRMAEESGVKIQDAEAFWKRLEARLRKKYL